MGVLDGLIGGAVGAALATATQSFIQQHGGVQGIIDQMQAKGLGDTVRSWVGTGANAQITPDQLHQVFGPDKLAALAQSLNIPQQELAQKLAQVLPQAVDHLTPNGAVPPSA